MDDSRGGSLILGCSPFVAARQFADRRAEYRARFAAPERIHQIWSAFSTAGGRALHLLDEPRLWDAFQSWPEANGSHTVSLTISSSPDPWLRALAERGTGGRAVLHARSVDAGICLRPFARRARAHGLEAWIATHQPARLFASRTDWGFIDGVLVPFNSAGLFMDGPPAAVADSAAAAGVRVVAMMTLGAGALPFLDGVGYAALRFPELMVGTGSVAHAAAIARLNPLLALFRSDVLLSRRAARDVDITEYPDQVTLLQNHRGLTLGGAAVRIWSALTEPSTFPQLIAVAADGALSDDVRPGVEASVAGLILRLAAWGVLRGEEA